MRKLQSRGVEREAEGQGGAGREMPSLRASHATKQGPEHVSVRLDGCRPENPLNGSQGLTRAGNIFRARKRKALRQIAAWSVRAELGRRVVGRRLTVTIGRISPRQYDSDGWQAAAKPLRDGIADALERKDNDPDIEWRYVQVRGKPKEYAVEILIEVKS